MTRLCANLSMLFREVDFPDRLAAAARAGFKAVECHFPYDYDRELLAELLHEHGLTQALFNLPAGDWGAGERGIACHPDRIGEFQDGVGLAIEYARALGCSRVNCLAGIAPSGADPYLLRSTLLDNLGYAAGKLAEADIGLLLEPINTRDVPGFQVCRTRQAMEIMDAVKSDNLSLQYDIYHMQIMEGDLACTIGNLIDRIGHIQLADNPGRHEPGTGEINFRFLLAHIDSLGYEGWIGCEYSPAGETGAGLEWAGPYL
ncbi:MAG: hydroxypyruvate isomerase [Gammaproteobacteria bacterium]|nr:hydroxypyruvate isomerase [Gammaproteobacteria bacterium]